MIKQVGHLLPDTVLRQYLLGYLNATVRGILERLYFEDDTLYRRLEIIEAELADDYACDRLSEPQRCRFERGYLTSARRRGELAVAEALRDDPTEPTPLRVDAPERLGGWTRWAVIVAGVMLVAGVWVFQARRQPLVFAVVVPTSRSDLRSPVETERPISVPPDARRVRFEIRPRKPRSGSYSAVLKVDGVRVESTGELAVLSPGILVFDVPREKLRTGTYALVLTAVRGTGIGAPPEEYRFELLLHP